MLKKLNTLFVVLTLTAVATSPAMANINDPDKEDAFSHYHMGEFDNISGTLNISAPDQTLGTADSVEYDDAFSLAAAGAFDIDVINSGRTIVLTRGTTLGDAGSVEFDDAFSVYWATQDDSDTTAYAGRKR